MTVTKLASVLAAAVLIVALVLVGPLLVIWSMNTLWPMLNIAYTWQTWISVVILAGVFKTSVVYGKKQ